MEAVEEFGHDINSPYGKEVRTKRMWMLLKRFAMLSTLPIGKVQNYENLETAEEVGYNINYTLWKRGKLLC